MKTIICILLSTLVQVGYSQMVNSYLKERAEKNLEILAKDYQIKQRVRIDAQGIHLSNSTQQSRTYAVYWTEMGHFISNVENADYYEVQRLFAKKGTQAIANYKDELEYLHYQDYPTNVDELRVVLDPGHFGGNLEEAAIEGRILRMSASDARTKEDVAIYEAYLNYVTALLIKQKLNELGCLNVLLTRPFSTGSIGLSFSDWIDSRFTTDLQKALKSEDISKEYFNQVSMAGKSPTIPANRHKLFEFYRFLDFRSRIDKSNKYSADITLSIHYNASDNSRPYNAERYYKPTQSNYNMFFVPGAFLYNELEKTDATLDFLRLLVSPDIDNSVTLSSMILTEQEKILGVPPAKINDESKLYKVTLPTEAPGVYARNLPQLRMIRGTVVYGETLLQDNATEAAALGAKDFQIQDESGAMLWVPRRADQVAQGYVNGIVEFLRINKDKKLKFSASIKN